MPPPTTQPRLRASLPGDIGRNFISLNQLPFKNLALVGRDSEIAQLREAYARIRSAKSAIEIVLLSGNAGTGKSAIAKKLGQEVKRTTKDLGGFFAWGKFDLQMHAEPYSAFLSAFGQLCEDILAFENTGRKARDAMQLRNAIKVAIGDESTILSEVVPNLKQILFEGPEAEATLLERRHLRSSAAAPFDSKLGTTAISSSIVRKYHMREAAEDLGGIAWEAKADGNNYDGRKSDKCAISDYDGRRVRNKFNFIMRCFVGAICSPSHPLVLFLDDLHWADAASLELLETLVHCREIFGLLVVGCYRDNEVDEQTHPLAALLRKITKPGRGLSVTQVLVRNLDSKTVNDLISDLLDTDKSKTQGLAAIVHKKTLGNALFVRHFLSKIHDEGMLTYSMGLLRWTWDENMIRTNTSVADNVVDLLRHKLKSKMDCYAQEVLQMAACLGSTFDERVLVAAAAGTELKIHDQDSPYQSKKISDRFFENEPEGWRGAGIIRCLAMFVAEGLLDTKDTHGEGSSTTYWFVHDQIKEAAYSLIPADKCNSLKLRMGESLLDSNPKSEVANVLFIIVDLLNSGVDLIPPGKKRQQLAELNLKAGEKAMSSSAFSTAAAHLKTGISLLGPKHWEEQYSLSLKLYSTVAQADYCISDFDHMHEAINEVLAQKNVPFDDKLQVRSVLVKSLTTQSKNLEAIDECLGLLKQMGVHCPMRASKIAVISALVKTKRLFKGQSKSTLSELPVMKDKTKMEAMRLMNSLCTSAYMAKPDLLPLVILKMVRWSRYEVNEFSTIAFAAYGLLLCSALGDLKGGQNFGELALLLSKKLKARETEAKTIMVANYMVFHWTKPLHDTMRPFLRGYRVGMETGDVENAMFCANGYCRVGLHIGRPLSLLEKDMRFYCQLMKDHEQDLTLQGALVHWQIALNFMGRSGHPTVLTGEAMNQEKALKKCAETQNAYLANTIKTGQLWLAYFFGDYDLAAKLVHETKDTARLSRSSFIVWRTALFESLTFFALARKYKSKRFMSLGSSAMKKIQKWTKSGNMNCVYMLSLLKAEKASLEEKEEEARKAYQKAITVAGRSGFPQDKALANELAGTFFVDTGDIYWAKYHLQEAHQLYIDWEASAKANQLCEQHFDILSGVDNIPTHQRSEPSHHRKFRRTTSI